jgi:hypothetical protein
MKTEEILDEAAIISGIEELRQQFPRTQDLYREVCVLLFFRHGITPTANKLYQLVRKGSMSAPTEALSQFWKTLRERSRITIEHSDLPDELRTAAGELVATLWKSAQSKSLESVATFKEHAAIEVANAKADLTRAIVAHADALQVVEHLRSQLLASENEVTQLREERAAAIATRASLDDRLKDARHDFEAMQVRLSEQSLQHADERERLAARARLAEERFSEMEKRSLQEIDRERTNAAKLQRKLDSDRIENAAAIQQARADYNEAQATIARFREQIGALQNAVEVSKHERDRDRAELLSVRAQLEIAMRQAAAESARADLLRDELKRSHADTRSRPGRTTSSGPNIKRRRNTGGVSDT